MQLQARVLATLTGRGSVTMEKQRGTDLEDESESVFSGPRQMGLNGPVWSASCLRSQPACASRVLLHLQPWMELRGQVNHSP